ncbi:MAG: hypothetical protein ACJ8EL_22535 [Rhizomicrobium sp.]
MTRVWQPRPDGRRLNRHGQDGCEELNAQSPGEPVGWEPKSELDHFFRCEKVRADVDMRRLGDVIHHEEPFHEPIPQNA